MVLQVIQKLALSEAFHAHVSSYMDILRKRAPSLKDDPLYLRILIISLATSLLVRIFILSKYMEMESEGDSYLHYLLSQAWIHAPLKNSGFLISVWGKPLFTLVCGIILKLTTENIITIKLFNIVVWMGVICLIYLIAKELKLNNEIAFFTIFFSSFSFLALRYSTGALTEPLFTFIVIAAYYFLLREQFILSSLLVSISFLCRTEGVILIIIWGFYFLIKRDNKSLIILPIFPMLWDFIGFLKTGDILYVMSKGYPLISPYGRGDFGYYINGFLKYDPFIFLFFLLNLLLCRNSFKFIKVCVLSFFVFNIIIWKYGLLGSAGYLRYFLPMIPFMSLLASASLAEIANFKKHIPIKDLKFMIYVVIIILQVINAMTLIWGHGLDYNTADSPAVNKGVIDSGNFIRSLDSNKTLYADDPAIIYFSGRILGISSPQWVGQPPSGARNIYFAYDNSFSKNWGNKKLDYYLGGSTFKFLGNFSDYVYVFER